MSGCRWPKPATRRPRPMSARFSNAVRAARPITAPRRCGTSARPIRASGAPRPIWPRSMKPAGACPMTAADFASLGLDEQAVARAVVENEGLRRELETERARLADLRGNIERQQAREQNTRIRLQTLEADRRRLLQQSWDIQTSTQAAV